MALENLGERIRTLRKVRNLSQEALARRADVSLNLVGKLELGMVTNPHYSTLAGLARALGVTVEELVEEPVLAGKAEAPPETRRLPEWATTSDLNVLSWGIAELSPEELRDAAMRLATGVKLHRTLEDARNETSDETTARVLNFARIHALRAEFLRRGEEPPEKFVLVYREWLRALAPLADSTSDDASGGISEAG